MDLKRDGRGCSHAAPVKCWAAADFDDFAAQLLEQVGRRSQSNLFEHRRRFKPHQEESERKDKGFGDRTDSTSEGRPLECQGKGSHGLQKGI